MAGEIIKCWYCNEEVKVENNLEHLGICDRCYSEMFKTTDALFKKKDNEIAELKTKLAEKEERIAELEDKDWYEATIKQLEEANGRLIKQRDDAKLQLAEKEKEVKQLKRLDDLNRNFYDILRTAFRLPNKVDDLFNSLKAMQEKQDKDKISFCIERLEKVKEEAKHYGYDFSKSMHEFVDNQIEELKKLEELKGDGLNGKN